MKSTACLRLLSVALLFSMFFCRTNAVAAAPGQSAQARLEAFVAKQNASASADNKLGQMSWKLEPHALVWTTYINNNDLESVIASVSANDSPDLFKRILTGILSRNRDMKDLRDILVDTDTPFEIVWILSDKKLQTTLSVPELENLVFNIPASRLQGIVEVARAQCPKEVEPGLTMTDCKLDDKFLTYSYSTEKDNIELLRGEGSEIRIATLRDFLTNAVIAGMLKLTSDEGVDIKYHYYEAASPANFVDFIIAPRTRDVYLAE